MSVTTLAASFWDDCLKQLKQQIPIQQFSTWLRPLQAEIAANQLILFAPNQFVVGHVNEHFLEQIVVTIAQLSEEPLEVWFVWVLKKHRLW